MNASILAPDGYEVIIDDEPADLFEYISPCGTGDSYFRIKLRSIEDVSRAPAGAFSGISVGQAVAWNVGLGGLRNGGTAGRITYREIDLSSAPASASKLHYELPFDAAMQVTEQIDVIPAPSTGLPPEQIMTPQVFVDITSDGSGGHWQKFYDPASVTLSGGSYSSSESPWRTIHVASDGANKLEITTTEGTVTQISELHLTSGSVASGAYVWRLREGDESSWLRTTTHTGTMVSGQRQVLIQTRTGGTSGTVVSENKHVFDNPYSPPYEDIEELIQVVQNPNGTNPLTTSYDYHTDPAQRGNFRRIKSITEPSGNWHGLWYSNSWSSRGQLQREFFPYGNSPSSVPNLSTQYYADLAAVHGRTIKYAYGPDWTERDRLMSLRQERINGVVSGKSTSSVGQVTVAGEERSESDAEHYRDDTNTQDSLTQRVSGNEDEEIRGRVRKQVAADGTQVSADWADGAYNASTKVFTVGGSGDFWRSVKVHGTTDSSGATPESSWNGHTFDSVNLVSGRSTLEAVVLNPAGLPVLSEVYVYTGGSSFERISWTASTYDAKGRLTNTESANGAETDYLYSNGRLVAKVAPNGSETSYSYDALGRAATITKEGVSALAAELTSGYSYPAQPDVVTTNTYDGANRVTQQVVSSGGLSLTTTRVYDKAGRLTSTTAPGGFTTAQAYSSNHRSVTVTLPGGGTKTTEVYRDGQLKQVYGTAVVDEFHSYFLTGGNRSRQTNHGGVVATAVNTQWDWLGREIRQDRPQWGGSGVGWMISKWHYNDAGQLTKSETPGMAPTVYEYDTLGYMWRSGLDVDGGGLDDASMDRITETAQEYQKDSGTWWHVQQTHAFLEDNVATKTLMSSTSTKLTNLAAGRLSESQTEDVFGNLTTTYTEIEPAHFLTISTTDTPLSTDSHSVAVTYNGRAVETQDPSGIIILTEHDALGRPTKAIHPRTGTTETAYASNSDLVLWTKDTTGTTQATYAYDAAGRVAAMADAYGNATRYAYNSRDQVTHTWGEATYPTKNVYDVMGRRTELHTYRGGSGWDSESLPGAFSGSGDVTEWAYDPATGLLDAKIDAASREITYTYTAAGQLESRTWARGLVTDYAYDSATGELLSTDYDDDDATPDVAMDYNRRGLLDSVVDHTGTRSFDYCDCGKVSTEHLGSFHSSRRILYDIDDGSGGLPGRSRGYRLRESSGSSNLAKTLYEFDSAGRLDTVITGGSPSLGAMGAYTFEYGYLADSNLITTLDVTAPAATAPFNFTRTWKPDRNLVATAETHWGASTVAEYTYTYDDMHRRITAVQGGNAFSDYLTDTHRRYAYNARSELTADIAYANDDYDAGSPGDDMSSRRFEFAYDNLGNRTSSNRTGVAALADVYTANQLNQYTAREHNTLAVAGTTASTSATVAVVAPGSGAYAAGRAAGFWGTEVVPANASGPVQQTVDVIGALPGAGAGGADLVDTKTTSTAVPPASETMAYDEDGNKLRDGLWRYTWDAENRLTTMYTRGAPGLDPDLSLSGSDPDRLAAEAVWSSGIARQKLEFAYDYLHRRVRKKSSTWNGSSWALIADRKFIYDGWNIIREDEMVTSKVRTYTWGLDLTGSLTKSGGVGALLAIRDTATSKRYLPGYDANGNVAVMVNAANGTIEAAYEYGPFGESLRADGDYAEANPIRFSTKYTDEETDLVYYGRRYYDPKDGRFVGRDPIEEQGGINLYAFVANNTVSSWDYLGMNPFDEGAFYDWLSPEARDNYLRQRRQEQRNFRFLAGILEMKAAMVDGGGAGNILTQSHGDRIEGFFAGLIDSGFLKPSSDSPPVEGDFTQLLNAQGEVLDTLNGTYTLDGARNLIANSEMPNGDVSYGPLQVMDSAGGDAPIPTAAFPSSPNSSQAETSIEAQIWNINNPRTATQHPFTAITNSFNEDSDALNTGVVLTRGFAAGGLVLTGAAVAPAAGVALVDLGTSAVAAAQSAANVASFNIGIRVAATAGATMRSDAPTIAFRGMQTATASAARAANAMSNAARAFYHSNRTFIVGPPNP